MSSEETPETNENLPESVENSVDEILAQSSNDVPPAVSPDIVTNTPLPAGRAGDVGGGVVGDTTKRKRGRPPKDGKTPTASQAQPSAPRPKLHGVQPPPNPDDAAIIPCAEILTMMTNASGMVLAQGDAGAMTQEEQLLVKTGYVGYLKAKGVQNVPPWVILAGSLSPYYLRIITTTPAKTTVASGLRKAWFGIKEFFIRKKDAYANRRNDTKREVDTSEKTSEPNV